LESLSQAEIDQLAAVSRIAEADRGKSIWLHGAEVEFIGLVVSGFVKMTRSTFGGPTAVLEIMGPNQMFGFLGALSDGCPLSAIALTGVTYLRIPKSAILAIYETNAGLKDKLLRRTADRMHESRNLMAQLSSGRVPQRLAAVLLVLAQSYSRKDGKATKLILPLTRTELAEMAGTTTESCIRTLSKWHESGLIDDHHHRIVINDLAALEELLEGSH
jgi:CRP-like cAMP-binding protein